MDMYVCYPHYSMESNKYNDWKHNDMEGEINTNNNSNNNNNNNNNK